MTIQKPRGTEDWQGEDYKIRQFIKSEFINLAEKLGFSGIEIPAFEQKNLYVRSAGDESDIVQKELFLLENKSENEYVLRPEPTAGIARSLIENGYRDKQLPIKLYFVGEVFRYDKPQKGRYRQLTQCDAEIFGLKNPSVDVYGINTTLLLLEKAGLKDKIVVNINSLGSNDTKSAYAKKIKEYFSSSSEGLCEDCKRRLDKNPLRILDCKVEDCKQIIKGAPGITESLSVDEKKYFGEVVSGLKSIGAKVNIDPSLVRGLDYYTSIIFEINLVEDEARKMSLCGGGRYDNLITELEGGELAAFGFGIGVERLADVARAQILEKLKPAKKVIILPVTINESQAALETQNKLADLNIDLTLFLKETGLGQALSEASKNKYQFAVIIGEKEVKENNYTLKNLEDGTQEVLSFDDLVKKFS